MTQSPAILGIGGSPRRGNSEALLEAVLAGAAEAGAKTESMPLRQVSFGTCIGCERCRRDKICTRLIDGMQIIYPLLIESPGLVLVTPVHNYNVSALMKAFIDRLYCFYDFTNDHPRGFSSRLANQGRKALCIAVAEQTDPKEVGFTIEAMTAPLEALGCEVVGTHVVLGKFAAGVVKKDEDAMNHVRNMGRTMAKALG
jgi:multimeric flavodoxin WrbA